MRTLTVIALAVLLLFLGYRAVNPKFVDVNQSTNQSHFADANQPQLIEVIIEEVEE